MNNNLKNEIIDRMITLYKGDPKRIQHFLKVTSFAEQIGSSENLSEYELNILTLAALLHDIGIIRCEELYGSAPGNLQELEGPGMAGELLDQLEVEEDVIDRVCFLISKHHTVKDVEGLDWQILLESDFLVNAFEDSMTEEQIRTYRDNVFKTQKGINILNTMFNLS